MHLCGKTRACVSWNNELLLVRIAKMSAGMSKRSELSTGKIKYFKMLVKLS